MWLHMQLVRSEPCERGYGPCIVTNSFKSPKPDVPVFPCDGRASAPSAHKSHPTCPIQSRSAPMEGVSTVPLRHPLSACHGRSLVPLPPPSPTESSPSFVRYTVRTTPATSARPSPHNLTSIGVPTYSIYRKAFPYTCRFGIPTTLTCSQLV